MGCVVNISGKGLNNYCHAKVNGTVYVSATSNISLTTNVIELNVYGFPGDAGTVTIDGEVVFSSTAYKPETYRWTVPENVGQINIELNDPGSITYIVVTTIKKDTSSKTLVDGTHHKITGGKVMVDGTVYDVFTGRAMVDGTLVDIKVGKKKYKVTISLAYTSNSPDAPSSVVANGVTYDNKRATINKTIELEAGTEIVCTRKRSGSYTVSIQLNGTTVASATRSVSYTYVLSADVTISVPNDQSAMTIVEA